VFGNLEQIEGVEVLQAEGLDFEPIEAAEQIVDAMPQRPPILHQDPGKAWYDPWGDKVKIPQDSGISRPFGRPQGEAHGWAE